MHIAEFQALIRDLYLDKDSDRGLEGTYMWFAEEVGELTRALRRGADDAEVAGEFADVFAWLVSMASMRGIDLEAAATEKYFKDGVPGHEKDRRQRDTDGAENGAR